MIDLFISAFVFTALAFIFAQAWNMVAMQALQRYAFVDKDGVTVHPVRQTTYYAIGISLFCIAAFYFVHNHTNIQIK